MTTIDNHTRDRELAVDHHIVPLDMTTEVDAVILAVEGENSNTRRVVECTRMGILIAEAASTRTSQ